MGYSGLIYAAIVAAWAAFLVPRWVRRNEELEQAVETDAVRGVRVLQRRTSTVRSGHGRAGSTVLHGRADGLVVGAASTADSSDPDAESPGQERSDADPVAAIDTLFAKAARRRRRLLIVLLIALVGTAGATNLGYLPLAAPIGVGVMVFLFLFVARRAAVRQAGRRRAAIRRAALLAERRAADEAASDEGDGDLTADGKRVAVYEAPEVPEVDPDAWEPVAVPRPTYLDKAVAPSLPARSIDLSAPGAWTSGRLDPAGSIDLPPQRRKPLEEPPSAAVVEESPAEEVYPEHRRAVGD